MMTHFFDQNFQAEVLESKEPVLVDFFAPWCGPCQQMMPVIEELSAAFAGKVKIGKLNVDESPATAEKYGVMSIPTLIFFKNGQEAERMAGARGKSELAEKLSELVK